MLVIRSGNGTALTRLLSSLRTSPRAPFAARMSDCRWMVRRPDKVTCIDAEHGELRSQEQLDGMRHAHREPERAERAVDARLTTSKDAMRTRLVLPPAGLVCCQTDTREQTISRNGRQPSGGFESHTAASMR